MIWLERGKVERYGLEMLAGLAIAEREDERWIGGGLFRLFVP